MRYPLLIATIAALHGAAGVALAAMAAHVDASPLLATASQFLSLHAAAGLGLAGLLRSTPHFARALQAAGFSMQLGVTLFAADLAARVFLGGKLFPFAAPLGGGLSILSWTALAALALAAFLRARALGAAATAPAKLDFRGNRPHDVVMSTTSASHGHTAAPSDEALRRASDPLLGRRILIVEDDPYITLALEETLAESGLVVIGAARTLATALRLATEAPVELALLDVNIGQERIDPVADALRARGCPFVFTTGCGRAGLPEAYADAPIVEKPFYLEEIMGALRAVLAGPAAD